MSQELTSIVGDLLARCDFALSSTPVDDGFLQLCLEDAATRGCPMEASPGIPSFRPWNVSGAAIAYISYGHLESLPAKLFIALYTSLAVYAEDVYTDQPDLVNTFNANFVTRQPQRTAILQALDKLLGETSRHFDAVQANLITSIAGPSSSGDRQPVKARRKRMYRVGSKKKPAEDTVSPDLEGQMLSRRASASPTPPSEFDADDMDRYFRTRDDYIPLSPTLHPSHIRRRQPYDDT
ncbi:hypothetical protein PTI98_005428 [Pleurotus ostreatus]|nr:hypothetical protein PTI98_005428 [Pleurotus ostreatus]